MDGFGAVLRKHGDKMCRYISGITVSLGSDKWLVPQGFSSGSSSCCIGSREADGLRMGCGADCCNNVGLAPLNFSVFQVYVSKQK